MWRGGSLQPSGTVPDRRWRGAPDHGATRAACGLLAQQFLARGIGPGKVVSFMLPNWHEAAAIYLAATLVGAVAHPVVPQLRDNEVVLHAGRQRQPHDLRSGSSFAASTIAR
jgi:acyl-CoA synthetase (AMP-forming)/AMP-acid ligase II